MLLDAGVKTNIHYVLGKNSIDEALERLRNNDFPKGINAVIFLLHKPVEQGTAENILSMEVPTCEGGGSAAISVPISSWYPAPSIRSSAIRYSFDQ